MSKKFFSLFVILMLLVTFNAFAGGKKEPTPAEAKKPFSGQKITCLYFSATYAEAAKGYAA